MSNNNEIKLSIKDEELYNGKRNVIIDNIEAFIEKKNRYIQVVLLFLAVIAGSIYGFVDENLQTIIRYTLVLNIFMEIYILQTKDSIMQKKINWLSVDVTTQNGGLRFEEEIDIGYFFENAKTMLFLSGIAPSRFIGKYQSKIESLLNNDENFRFYILISSLDAVTENSAQYYGTRDELGKEENRDNLLSKLSSAIDDIRGSKILKKAFDEKRLLLATSDIVFTTSCVGYDIDINKIIKEDGDIGFEPPKYHSQIKVTFYQQGKCQVGKLPCVLIDSDKNIRDMYPYFSTMIAQQWKAAQIIAGESELKFLRDEIVNSRR